MSFSKFYGAWRVFKAIVHQENLADGIIIVFVLQNPAAIFLKTPEMLVTLSKQDCFGCQVRSSRIEAGHFWLF
jgi:hypothetical protein